MQRQKLFIVWILSNEKVSHNLDTHWARENGPDIFSVDLNNLCVQTLVTHREIFHFCSSQRRSTEEKSHQICIELLHLFLVNIGKRRTSRPQSQLRSQSQFFSGAKVCQLSADCTKDRNVSLILFIVTTIQIKWIARAKG